jgi:hypothetical protein
LDFTPSEFPGKAANGFAALPVLCAILAVCACGPAVDYVTLRDDGFDAGMFWRRFKELSDKDLPVILKTSIKQ